jgi:N-acyl-D-amino-acid deacylase
MRLKITNGTVYDGTGAPPLQADIILENERIMAIEAATAIPVDKEIDATGHIVCPGFIDVHTHSDAYILLEPDAPSKIHQGITTEIVGNCGASCAPLFGQSRMPADWTVHQYPGEWHSVADYRNLLETVGPGPNICLLVGHNTLRAGVMGYEARTATETEVRLMTHRLEEAMAEGACGISTGLVYLPGRYAASQEVDILAAAVARHDKIYASHMRSESSRLLEAIDETLAFGRNTGVRLQISHLKAYGQPNWHLLEPAIEKIRQAQGEGISVFADRYPYTASCTDLDIIFPDWMCNDGPAGMLQHLQDPATRARIIQELQTGRDENYWQRISIGSTAHPDNHRYQGQPILAIARAMQCSPAEAAVQLALKDELRTSAFFHGMSRENMLRVLAEPYVMIGSDASLRAPTGPLSHDWPHPRAYGTFPRFLRMALDADTVPLPEAIRKMTSLPAEAFRLRNRGILRKGYAADLVVFDPAIVCDQSAFDRPHAMAVGISHVIVNGTITLEHGKLTHQRNGRFLA